jgi:hypothetical protein
MNGTAILGMDYALDGNPGHVVIWPGQSSANVTLTVTTTRTKGKEKATMILGTGGGYDLPSSSGRHRAKPPQATVTIRNR